MSAARVLSVGQQLATSNPEDYQVHASEKMPPSQTCLQFISSCDAQLLAPSVANLHEATTVSRARACHNTSFLLS